MLQRSHFISGLPRSGSTLLVALAFDARADTPWLHTVQPRVAVNQRASIQPPDLFKRFACGAFRRDPVLNPRGIRII